MHRFVASFIVGLLLGVLYHELRRGQTAKRQKTIRAIAIAFLFLTISAYVFLVIFDPISVGFFAYLSSLMGSVLGVACGWNIDRLLLYFKGHEESKFKSMALAVIFSLYLLVGLIGESIYRSNIDVESITAGPIALKFVNNSVRETSALYDKVRLKQSIQLDEETPYAVILNSYQGAALDISLAEYILQNKHDIAKKINRSGAFPNNLEQILVRIIEDRKQYIALFKSKIEPLFKCVRFIAIEKEIDVSDIEKVLLQWLLSLDDLSRQGDKSSLKNLSVLFFEPQNLIYKLNELNRKLSFVDDNKDEGGFCEWNSVSSVTIDDLQFFKESEYVRIVLGLSYYALGHASVGTERLKADPSVLSLVNYYRMVRTFISPGDFYEKSNDFAELDVGLRRLCGIIDCWENIVYEKKEIEIFPFLDIDDISGSPINKLRELILININNSLSDKLLMISNYPSYYKDIMDDIDSDFAILLPLLRKYEATLNDGLLAAIYDTVAQASVASISMGGTLTLSKIDEIVPIFEKAIEYNESNFELTQDRIAAETAYHLAVIRDRLLDAKKTLTAQ